MNQSLNGIKAVVFDVFGTMAEIGEKRRPYARVLDLLATQGRWRDWTDPGRIMTSNVGLAGVAPMLGKSLPADELAEIELDLYAELATIHLFPEVAATLKALRDAGYKIGLCSNLAAPYALPIKLLLPFQLDAYAWSFEVGAAKPESEIFTKVCSDLGCEPGEVLMVGDTWEADFLGPRRIGMQALFLDRLGRRRRQIRSIRSLDEVLPHLETLETIPAQ